MSDKTGIEWTDATWNPVTGCAKVSQGCKHCYALREWPRMSANPKTVYFGREFTDVMTHADRLDQPMRWNRSRKVFVNSMSDLFHESVPFDFIDRVFAVMALANKHIFQVLTKRPERMHAYFKSFHERESADRGFNVCAWADSQFGINDEQIAAIGQTPNGLPNVWLGVSVEDQSAADERIPLLLQTPAAVRWISAEPLLGPVDLNRILVNRERDFHVSALHEQHDDCYYQSNAQLDWVVVGGESGPKARPMNPDWARRLRDQCAEAGTPFLFKQWGEWLPDNQNPAVAPPHDPSGAIRVGKKAAGRILDGVQHDGYPMVNKQ